MSSNLAVIEFIQKALARLDARIQRMVNQYRATETEILARVLSGVASEKISGLRERRRQEAQVRTLLRVLDDNAQVEVPSILDHAADVARRASAITFGEKPASLSVTNKQSVLLLTENLLEDLGAATQTVGRRVEDIFRKEGLHKAQSAIIGEQPQAFVSAELQRALRKDGVTAFYDSSGRQWTLGHYADMASKTVAQEAVNVVQRNLLQERGIDLVSLNHSPKCCDDCKPYDGKTFSLTGRAEGHPILDKYPPFHGFCHHVLFAAPDAFKERTASGWEPAFTTTPAGVVI